MPRGQRKYNDEFKNTIVEFYNYGKTLAEHLSEYGISKIHNIRLVKKVKPGAKNILRI